MHNKSFGFLSTPLKGAFEGVTIDPVGNHTQLLHSITNLSNRDGFYYPPQIAQYNIDPRSGERQEKVERSEKPASLFWLPASHSLSIQNPVEPPGATFADDALLVYALAMLYGTRLQLAEWQFDGRVPLKPLNNIYISEETSLHFLEHFYKWWKALAPKQRTSTVNILYVHTRANSLEWDWDSFIHHYMTFDAIYRLHADLTPAAPVARSHRERFNVLINTYGVAPNDTLVDKIYKTRNELFHEAMWTGATIGYGSKDQGAFHLPRHLSRLNERLLCNLIGYKNEFATSIWWSISTFLFNKPARSPASGLSAHSIHSPSIHR